MLAPICIIMIVLCLSAMVGLYLYKMDAKGSYILQTNLKTILWKKVIKIYFIIFGVIYLLQTGKPTDWSLVIGIPFIIISMMLISNVFHIPTNTDTYELDSKEFQDYKSAYTRDQKIKKILNRWYK